MAADYGLIKHGEIEEHVTIEVIPEGNLVLSIKEKMEDVSISGTICRVPSELFKENKDQFLPMLVSIGPLHHDKVTKKAMEDVKWRYLNAILARKPGLDQTLDSCVKSLKNLENKARKCYQGHVLDHIGSNDFVQMMLLDGCFIIELFFKFAVKSLRRRDDPCFSRYEKFFIMRRDLILLENQIPFFVLQQLFHLIPIPKQCNNFSLIELALIFFKKWIPLDYGQNPQEKFGLEVHHLLDLIRQCYLPAIPEFQPRLMKFDLKLPNVEQLKDQGIDFCGATDDLTLLNIKFDDGILEMPPLKIYKHTEILFKNLIALESCSRVSPKHITSYVFLMKQLIKTRRDVKMLQRKRIFVSGLGKQEEIIHLFKSFDHLDMKVEDFYYGWIIEEIFEEGKIKVKKHWRHKLKHFYSRTPFGVAGFSIALLVVVSIFTAALFWTLAFLLHHF